VKRCASFLVCLFAGLSAAADARAGENESLFRPVAPERRNGLVLGVSGGIAAAGASGTPNSARLFDDPDYYSSSPLLVGWSTSYFLMGALNDYFSFGPMVSIAQFESPK
jgi:hypothetical protein